MNGTRIFASAMWRGVVEHVYVEGTPYPGTCMEIQPSTAAVGGVFTYQAYGTQAYAGGQYVENDGDRKAIAVLIEKDSSAGLWKDAYADGDMGRIYWPVMGEWLNMLMEDVAGTGDDVIIGEEFMIDDGTGMLLVADANAEAHPFTALEAVTNPTADHWVFCRFNGEGGA